MRSPWLHELQRLRPVSTLYEDTTAETAIIGAGIAGISTAFFILKYTKRSVILIDSSKVAHGATGHNAGQITSYFERPFSEMVKEFGLSQAIAGQHAIDNAWTLLDEIAQDTQLITPIYHVTGYAGFSTEERVHEHLKNNALKIQGGATPEVMYIAKEWLEQHPLSKEYHELYSAIPSTDIAKMLETKSAEYIACIESRKGCTNSAKLCEEIIGFLMRTYPGRFVLAEHAHIDTIQLHKEHQILKTQNYTIRTNTVILCTNGFEHFSIEDEHGEKINSRFHAMIHGTIGYMVGYEKEHVGKPTAKSYFPQHPMTKSENEDPDAYYYLTRRPFISSDNTASSLICVGGPEDSLAETDLYSSDIPHAESALRDSKAFLDNTFKNEAPKEFTFQWHGLMGYTPNAIRRIGPDPAYPELYYNLGCNGVGILPSLYGGRRIARYLANEKMEPTIFDIKK